MQKYLITSLFALFATHWSFAGSWITKELEPTVAESSLIISGIVIRVEANILKPPTGGGKAKFEDRAIVMIRKVLKCDLDLQLGRGGQPLQMDELGCVDKIEFDPIG